MHSDDTSGPFGRFYHMCPYCGGEGLQPRRYFGRHQGQTVVTRVTLRCTHCKGKGAIVLHAPSVQPAGR